MNNEMPVIVNSILKHGTLYGSRRLAERVKFSSSDKIITAYSDWDIGMHWPDFDKLRKWVDKQSDMTLKKANDAKYSTKLKNDFHYILTKKDTVPIDIVIYNHIVRYEKFVQAVELQMLLGEYFLKRHLTDKPTRCKIFETIITSMFDEIKPDDSNNGDLPF